MDANCTAAVRALPALGFLGDEFSDAEFLNIPKIFDHAHMIFAAIAFIQMPQSLTGEILAGKAKCLFAILKESAILDFAPGNTNWFLGIK
jgi:hypothetical protein